MDYHNTIKGFEMHIKSMLLAFFLVTSLALFQLNKIDASIWEYGQPLYPVMLKERKALHSTTTLLNTTSVSQIYLSFEFWWDLINDQKIIHLSVILPQWCYIKFLCP